jgi:hypothetical protein
MFQISLAIYLKNCTWGCWDISNLSVKSSWLQLIFRLGGIFAALNFIKFFPKNAAEPKN